MQTPKTWTEQTSANQNDELMITGPDGTTHRISVENFHKSAPDASASARGYVTTGAQAFSGKKTFNGGIKTDSIDTENGLDVNGNTSITGTLETSGAASFGGDTSVTGGVTATGKLEGASLETSGAAAIGGNQSVTGNQSVGGTLEVTGKTTVKDDLEVDKSSTFKGDVSIEGNLNVAGVTTIDQQETATAQDYYIARLAASHGIAPGSAAGLAVVNYDGNGKMATIAVDKDGTWRVADSASNTATTYQNLCVFNGVHYSGLTHNAAENYPQHIITNANSITLENVVWLESESAYFHYDGEDWKEILSVTDGAFVFDTAVSDAGLIAALEALTKYTLLYYISVTDNAIDASENQPLLTRAEEADLADGKVLKWNNTAKRAEAAGFTDTQVQQALAALPDLQPKTLLTPLSIDGVNKTSVELALTALNEFCNKLSVISGYLNSAVMHRNIFRGRCLNGDPNTLYPTTPFPGAPTYPGLGYTIKEVFNMIADGSFSDVWTGDYFIDTNDSNRVCRIADLDAYMKRGHPTKVDKHHAVIVPDYSMASAQWNTTNTTSGGYPSSNIKAVMEGPSVLGKINTFFGSSRIIGFNPLEPQGDATWGWASALRYLSPMSEVEIYGSSIFGNGYQSGTACTLLALFGLMPELAVGLEYNFWLISVTSSSAACFVADNGHAYHLGASASLGCRPRFLFGGEPELN